MQYPRSSDAIRRLSVAYQDETPHARMSGDSEEPGESSSDRPCRCGEARALSAVVSAAIDNGVHFQDPFAVYVDPQVVMERGVRVGAGSHLIGATRVEADASIGPNVIIEDSTVGSGAEIGSFSVVSEGSKIAPDAIVKRSSEVRGSVIASGAEIGPNAIVEESSVASRAKVGPFCRVRAGSDIGSDAYVGTQAEVKASRIGTRSKVGHFSFIGDADLGCDVNIGAGSVTANYDGTNVQKTVIANGASIGASCVLVAPLRLGIRARTGAGAVVTRDVADGDLVVGVPARVHVIQRSAA